MVVQWLMADLYVLKNTARANSSFKTGEVWTPVCLPKSDPNTFSFAYVFHIVEGICLIIVSKDKDSFFDLSEWKGTFVEV